MDNEKNDRATADAGGTVSVYSLSKASDSQLIATKNSLFTALFSGSQVLRERFRRNDLFYQQRHWELVQGTSAADAAGLHPVTPMLFSTIESIHADIMDAIPDATLLGEQAEDAPKAAIMTDLTKYIYNRRRYSRVWREWALSLLVQGTAIQEVLWDKALYGGLGDVNLQNVSVRNFLWNPAVENIQDSEVVFKISFKPREWVESMYPREPGTLPDMGGVSGEEEYSSYYPTNRVRDDSKKPAQIVEMWWKEYEKDETSDAMLPKVYMAKFCGGRVLERHTDVSIYEHGLYPFVVTALTTVEGQLWGLGFPDIYGDLQTTIDRLDQIMIENAEVSAKMKMLVGDGAQVNESELTDWNKDVVHAARVGDDVLRWMQPKPLSPYTMQLKVAKQNDIKEESGQNAFVRGDGGKSVTAASAIMALQEAGSKRSRAIISKLYDAFADVTDMVLKLISENYTEERTFTITEPSGKMRNATASAAMTKRADKVPIEFDISVHVQKQVPYKTVYNDEKLIQLLQMGVIPPKVALQMMQFDRKDEVVTAMAEYDQEKQMIQILVEKLVEVCDIAGIQVPLPQEVLDRAGVESAPQSAPMSPSSPPETSGMALE